MTLPRGHIVVRAVLFVVSLLALDAACSSSDSPGISVHTMLERARATSAPSTTDLGYTVTLERGFLVTSTVNLEACSTSVRWVPDRRFLRLVKPAYAHEPGTPTHIGTPWVEALVGATDAIEYGHFAPPPGRYCALHYGIGPADADAEGLPADPDMVGKSLYLEGTYAGADGAAHPFSASTAASATFELAFPALELQSAGTTEIVVGKSAEHWFDGIEFSTATPDAIAAAVLTNLGASLVAVPE